MSRFPLGLLFAKQTVVDEHASELIPDRAVHQRRGDGRVDSARQGADDTAGADLGADAVGRLGDKGPRGPRRSAVTDAEKEIAQHLAPARRVRDLGVELDAEYALSVGERSNR